MESYYLTALVGPNTGNNAKFDCKDFTCKVASCNNRIGTPRRINLLNARLGDVHYVLSRLEQQPQQDGNVSGQQELFRLCLMLPKLYYCVRHEPVTQADVETHAGQAYEVLSRLVVWRVTAAENVSCSAEKVDEIMLASFASSNEASNGPKWKSKGKRPMRDEQEESPTKRLRATQDSGGPANGAVFSEVNHALQSRAQADPFEVDGGQAATSKADDMFWNNAGATGAATQNHDIFRIDGGTAGVSHEQNTNLNPHVSEAQQQKIDVFDFGNDATSAGVHNNRNNFASNASRDQAQRQDNSVANADDDGSRDDEISLFDFGFDAETAGFHNIMAFNAAVNEAQHGSGVLNALANLDPSHFEDVTGGVTAEQDEIDFFALADHINIGLDAYQDYGVVHDDNPFGPDKVAYAEMPPDAFDLLANDDAFHPNSKDFTFDNNGNDLVFLDDAIAEELADTSNGDIADGGRVLGEVGDDGGLVLPAAAVADDNENDEDVEYLFADVNSDLDVDFEFGFQG